MTIKNEVICLIGKISGIQVTRVSKAKIGSFSKLTTNVVKYSVR